MCSETQGSKGLSGGSRLKGAYGEKSDVVVQNTVEDQEHVVFRISRFYDQVLGSLWASFLKGIAH